MKSHSLSSRLAPVAFVLSAAGIALMAAPASAQQQTTMQVEAPAIRSAQLNNRVFKEFGGTYRLDDFTTVKIVKEGSKLVAVNDDGSRVEVHAIADNKLVSASGRTELRFTAGAVDRVSIVATSSSPLLAVAANTIV